jgi:subtilisin family serine protease
LASYSQYGATTVDIGAPGSAVMSTVPVSSKGKVVAGYSSYSGTSMATPHVTGAAALYKARNPGATAAQIKAALLNGTPTPSLQGKVATGDRLDISTW